MIAAPRCPLSVCIITFNEEDNIRACLESVAWADEIVVVDSLSTDSTVEICREFTPNVHQREWPGWREQKEYCSSLARHEWVLSLDADERVTPELRQSIETAVAEGGQGYDGFAIPRRAHYLGHWIRHNGWYPGWRVRLFRESRARWAGADPHDKVIVDGQLGKMEGDIIHYPYRSISDHLQTLDRYSSAGAESLFQQGARFSWWRFLLHPPWNAFRKLVLQAGFLDGVPGMLIVMSTCFGSMVKYAKLLERERRAARTEGHTPQRAAPRPLPMVVEPQCQMSSGGTSLAVEPER